MQIARRVKKQRDKTVWGATWRQVVERSLAHWKTPIKGV